MNTSTFEKNKSKLVRKAIRGDKRAVNALVEGSYKRILYTTGRMFGYEHGQEVAHKAVVEIIQSVKNLKDPQKFDAWMMRLVNLVCINEMKLKYRNQKYHSSLEDSYTEEHIIDDDREIIPEDYALDKEKRRVMMEVIDSLPQNYQDTLLDFFFHGMSYEDISRARDITIVKVKNDLYRGKLLLKKRLEEKEGKEIVTSLGVGGVPTLALVYQADASEHLSTEYCATFLQDLAIDPSYLAAASAPGAVQTSTFTQVILGSAATVVVTGGVLLAVVNSQPVPEDDAQVPPRIEAIAPQPDSAPVIESEPEPQPEVIETLGDMIGTEEEQALSAFQSGLIDEATWLSFLDRIGAEVEDMSFEHDYEYSLYQLSKQDKQLLLAERKSAADGSIEIFYHFGEASELPLMIEVILMFNEGSSG